MDLEEALDLATADQLITALQKRPIWFVLYAQSFDRAHNYQRFAWSPDLFPVALLQLLAVLRNEVAEIKHMQQAGGERVLMPWERPGFLGTVPFDWSPPEAPPPPPSAG